MDKNMGRQRVVNKSISAQQVLYNLTPALSVEGRNRGSLGVVPIGKYKDDVAFWDLDLAVVQPLIWAEKQWTLDKVDTRKGEVEITVPIGTAVGSSVTGEIEVPAGEVWYLCEHEIEIPEADLLSAGGLAVNFQVSSFPKVNDADKDYYDPNDPQVYLTTLGAKVSGGGLSATFAEIEAAGSVYDHRLIPVGAVLVDTAPTVVYADVKRDFRDGDELNTELRLVGGDKLTLVATVETAAVATTPIVVDLRVWGRVGKLLVT